MTDQEPTPSEQAPAPLIHVAPSPHLSDRALTTRRMMIDVLVALIPAMVAAVTIFGYYAVAQVATAVVACVLTEWILTAVRRRPVSVGDFSAVVTGVILAFSLPATCPWWVTVIASVIAIGIGKVVFGGVGMNLFNPAMVGRAFVMVGFAGFLAAGGYVAQTTGPGANVTQTLPWMFSRQLPDAVTQATPMTAAFKEGHILRPRLLLWNLFWGMTNGSVGETSAFALILGGLYLLYRRTASWEIPVGGILSLLVIGGVINLFNLHSQWTVLHHLCGGAFLLGVFFIATDPGTSPLTPKGKFIYGLLFGTLVMVIRNLTQYPEGVMFSVLLSNAVTPLINRWTIPRPVGGPVPAPVKK